VNQAQRWGRETRLYDRKLLREKVAHLRKVRRAHTARWLFPCCRRLRRPHLCCLPRCLPAHLPAPACPPACLLQVREGGVIADQMFALRADLLRNLGNITNRCLRFGT